MWHDAGNIFVTLGNDESPLPFYNICNTRLTSLLPPCLCGDAKISMYINFPCTAAAVPETLKSIDSAAKPTQPLSDCSPSCKTLSMYDVPVIGSTDAKYQNCPLANFCLSVLCLSKATI